jgi:hypothetical protein
MSLHRATCPLCDYSFSWHSSENPYDVIRKGAKHLATHEGQPSEVELFDRAALGATPKEWMPQA